MPSRRSVHRAESRRPDQWRLDYVDVVLLASHSTTGGFPDYFMRLSSLLANGALDRIKDEQ
jgi:hypothetical protein